MAFCETKLMLNYNLKGFLCNWMHRLYFVDVTILNNIRLWVKIEYLRNKLFMKNGCLRVTILLMDLMIIWQVALIVFVVH